MRDTYWRKAAIAICRLFLCLGILTPQSLAAQDHLEGPPAAIRIDFDAETMKVTAIQGYSNRTTGRALMPDDPVRIASISKLIVAFGVMRLVERGELDLHRDVSDYLGWRLRNPAFPDHPITLAHLLSHRSGLRDGINYVLAMDASLERELENLKAWDADHVPGIYFSYANLNSPVIAAVMEAATGKRFDQVIQEEVFQPLELDACFNWINCSDSKIIGAVTLYRSNGDVARDDLRGVRETCPVVPAEDGDCDLSQYRLGKTGSIFSPQGGLRISAKDLARIGQMFLRDGGGFLQSETLQDMADAVWTYNGSNGDSDDGYFCAYGLGMHILAHRPSQPECQPSPFKTGFTYWGHSGDAYSLKSGLWVTDGNRKGTAFFHTENGEDDPAGHCIWPCD